jgi:dTDP-4-dehydrorhamnose reductase
VINAAALTDIERCEADSGEAYRVNARAVAAMSKYCRAADIPLFHISTDHFFTLDGPLLHSERAPVALVNSYARTKFVAEGFALRAPRGLVLRTNITGLRNWSGRPTFAEWAIDALLRHKPLRLFEDFYSSTIDTPSFSAVLFDLIPRGATGILNLAARNCVSKRSFVHELAAALGMALDWDESASVRSLSVPRAESLGLDVSAAERLFGVRLPDSAQVCRNLVSQWENQQCAMPLAS